LFLQDEKNELNFTNVLVCFEQIPSYNNHVTAADRTSFTNIVPPRHTEYSKHKVLYKIGIDSLILSIIRFLHVCQNKFISDTYCVLYVTPTKKNKFINRLSP